MSFARGDAALTAWGLVSACSLIGSGLAWLALIPTGFALVLAPPRPPV